MSDPWRARLESLPAAPPHDPGGKVVVLSAHPDDEVLALGGWLSGQAGRELVFVTATDGEASHPGSPTLTPEQLRARRPHELVDALTVLGLGEPEVRRLELPDGSLEQRHDDLIDKIAPIVRDARLVLAPFEHDGHPDHDAVGRAARMICPPDAALWRFPLWTWAWTRPGAHSWTSSVRRLASSSADRQRKREAIAAFATQVKPLSEHPADAAVVDGALLRHALHAPEAVIV